MTKNTILIADDSEMNRELLAEMLGDQYNFIFAKDGVEALEHIGSADQIDLILLDVNMPNMGGFDVLRVMNERRWIQEVPVIIISAEDSPEFISNAYQLGVTDYIRRPFYAIVVQRRVENTLLMYSNQKRLIHLVEQQIFDREKINKSLINIFSNIIELRNHESGSHTLNVQAITNLLLNHLVTITDAYPLSSAYISLISTLSALHDIGKIKIPEAILNKPGKLTPEEWELMKTHSAEGDAILSHAELDQDSLFVKTGRSICRWHHEKYDGSGYPDGLVGDEIPIAAQVVSMADVYDALTSERCYKKAFPHEKAIEMILGGECGAFNPLLLRCLTEIAPKLLEMQTSSEQHYTYQSDIDHLTEELLTSEDLPQDTGIRRMLENERRKKEFFMECGAGIHFEYDKPLRKISYLFTDEAGNLTRKVRFSSKEESGNLLSEETWTMLADRLAQTTREDPVITDDITIHMGGKELPYHARLMALWPTVGNAYITVLGYLTPLT